MFKVLVEGCEPTRGSKYSACVDLYSAKDVLIGAGETVLVPLGVCVDDDFMLDKFRLQLSDNASQATRLAAAKEYNLFLHSHYLQLMLRSSLGKKGLILPNGVGVIDIDYKDEICLILSNPLTFVDEFDGRTNKEYKISKGDKIAQITLLEHHSYMFGIDTEEERVGGFGSTGK
jgi:dUTPase